MLNLCVLNGLLKIYINKNWILVSLFCGPHFTLTRQHIYVLQDVLLLFPLINFQSQWKSDFQRSLSPEKSSLVWKKVFLWKAKSNAECLKYRKEEKNNDKSLAKYKKVFFVSKYSFSAFLHVNDLCMILMGLLQKIVPLYTNIRLFSL